MNAVRWKAAIVMVAMLCAAIASEFLRPTKHLADLRPKQTLEQLFPTRFGNWVVDDRMPVQLVSPDQAALLNAIYNETLSRTYVNPAGDRVMLSVAYGGDQSDGTRAHRPDVCYPAQGFQITASSRNVLEVPGASLNVQRLVAKLGGRIEPITYWIVVGDRTVISGTEQKLAQLRYGLRGVVPDGMLVRVSTIDGDTNRAFSVQNGFVVELLKSLPPASVDRVRGAGA